MSHATVLVALDCKPNEIQEAVGYQMQPFDENGEWFADGSRWDWWTIGGRWSGYFFDGDVIQVKGVHPNKFAAKRLEQAQETWADYQKEDAKHRAFLFDIKDGTTKAEYLKSRTASWFPAHHAFLHNLHWHEASRMGWFGCEAKTECEAAGKPDYHRCKAKAKGAPEAFVVSWGDDEETWNFKFHDRFIKTLAPETWLVTVDYHV